MTQPVLFSVELLESVLLTVRRVAHVLLGSVVLLTKEMPRLVVLRAKELLEALVLSPVVPLQSVLLLSLVMLGSMLLTAVLLESPLLTAVLLESVLSTTVLLKSVVLHILLESVVRLTMALLDSERLETRVLPLVGLLESALLLSMLPLGCAMLLTLVLLESVVLLTMVMLGFFELLTEVMPRSVVLLAMAPMKVLELCGCSFPEAAGNINVMLDALDHKGGMGNGHFDRVYRDIAANIGVDLFLPNRDSHLLAFWFNPHAIKIKPVANACLHNEVGVGCEDHEDFIDQILFEDGAVTLGDDDDAEEQEVTVDQVRHEDGEKPCEAGDGGDEQEDFIDKVLYEDCDEDYDDDGELEEEETCIDQVTYEHRHSCRADRGPGVLRQRYLADQ
ncbi:unnamed protein product, partial [Prorocentrum cordatum]